MKKNRRHILPAALTALLLCAALVCGTDFSNACTGIYAGPETTDDGSVIIARSNDYQAVWGNHVTLTPRQKKAGRTMPVNDDCTVLADLPETTYKYTATPFLSSTQAAYDLGDDAAACTNECGVAITLTVTAFANDAALAADPLVENGLTENRSADLVICQSRTAREAVQVLASLIETYGSAECNIAMIADQEEAWYMEMYTGHQYAAVKLPADKVAAFGNEYNLEYLSDYEESITSEQLQRLPEEKDFAAYGKNGEMNLFDTYAGQEMVMAYSHMRTWIGHQVLAPSKYDEDYSNKARYPLCFTPDEKVSIQTVATLMRNRYEGTKYDPDKTGREDMRVIGSDTSLSVHALQVYPDLPAKMAAVTWESSGPAIYGVFVPFSNAQTKIGSAYGKDQPPSKDGNGSDDADADNADAAGDEDTAGDETGAVDNRASGATTGDATSDTESDTDADAADDRMGKDRGIFDAENYPYYAFKELCTLCVEKEDCEIYGKPVREYWQKAEAGMFAGMPEVLKRAAEMEDDAAADYITSYCDAMQTRAFNDVKQLVNEVMWAESADSNTMKMGRNPETGEVLKTKRVLPPLKISLDPSAYETVPDASAAKNAGKQKGRSAIPYLLALAALAIVIEIIAMVRAGRRKEKGENRP